MEPLSALGSAAAIAQFVDFGFKVLSNAREIYSSVSGATEENSSLGNTTREMQRLTEKLVAPELVGGTDEEKLLRGLVTECRSLSSQLLALLDRIKAKDPKSKFQIIRAAAKSKLCEHEKLTLQHRFNDCQLRLDRLLGALSRLVSTPLHQGWLMRVLTSWSRSETKERFTTLILSSKSGTRELPAIRTQIQELETKFSFIGEGIQQKLDNLLHFSQHLYIKAAQQKVLDVLAFDGMRNRIDTVANAHDSTFRWIFDDGSREGSDGKNDSDNEWAGVFDEAARAKVDSFVEWLSSGTGIYHIAGKLGSGKSTLMKHLAGHSRVREELQKWAGTSCFSPNSSARRTECV
jgi:hypothetical protein